MMRRSPAPPSPAFEATARGAQFRDRIAIVVKAPPEAIFVALQNVTLRDMKLAWLLGEIRYLPSRLAGRIPAAESRRPFVKTLTEGGTLILRDDAPREMITGSAAQLHRVHQSPQRFATREAFEAFDDPDHEKLFMSVRVAPTGRPGENWVVLEHATRPLSPLAERKFARYWRAIKPMGAFVTWQLLRAVRRRAERAAIGPLVSRRRSLSVHATTDERARALPGDERIPQAIATLTHGVTIRRAPRDVWPWLVQMGAGSRGGWYSYDWLDNGRRPSATRIVPELQHPAVGAIFPAMPGMTEGFTLLAIEPQRTLTLGWLAPDGTPEVTWTFVLDEITPGMTRLLVRVRGGPGYRFHGLPLMLTRVVVRIVHFIMQRKQLLGIASRAEGYASPDPVLTYFALAFGISWASGLFVLGPGGIPTTVERLMTMGPVMYAAMLAGPSVAGLLLISLVSGRAGLRELLVRLTTWRVGGRWYAVALLTAPVLVIAVSLSLSLLSNQFLPTVFLPNEEAPLVLSGLMAGLIVGIFEELGWTGFAIPRMIRRYGVLDTGLLVGVLWGAWHFPMFWEPNSFSGALPFAVLLVRLFSWLPAYRVLMVWVYDRTGSLLVAMLMHGSLTATQLIFMPPPSSGMTLMISILAWAAALWIVVAIVAVGSRWQIAEPAPRKQMA